MNITENGRLNELNSRWASSNLDLTEHPYLLNKRMIEPKLLADFGVRENYKDLIYPLRTLTSNDPIQYQIIDSLGDKKLHCSSDGQAVFQVFGNLEKAKKIIIAESLTKAAAIYQVVSIEDHSIAVINAVSSGGMVKCAKQLSRLFDVIIAADNDSHKTEKDAPKGILKQVFNVATELNLKVCIPIKAFKDWDDWLGASNFAHSEIWECIKGAEQLNVITTVVQNLTEWAEKNPISELLNNPIQPRDFLFENRYVPKGKVTICPAANGTGKTFLMTQIAIQAALGQCFMYDRNDRKFFNPLKPYKVLILSFEDDRQAFLERIHATIDHFPVLSKNKKEILKTLGNQIEILELPAISPNPLLTCLDSITNKVEPDQMYSQVVDLIITHGYELVFVDPFHYSTAASENDNNQMGQLMRHMTNIAANTNAGMFFFSHTTDSDPLRNRGATSIADRCRQLFKVATVDRLKTSNNQICKSLAKSIINKLSDSENYKSVLWFKMDKNTHGKEDPKPWILKRHSDGVISPISIIGMDKVNDDSIIIEYIESCEGSFASKRMIEIDLNEKLTISQASIKNKLQAMVDKRLLRICEIDEIRKIIDNPKSNATWYAVLDE
ncbi:AAA family ATPase [Thalassotalea sp. SU-HH00458]|uniref:AAA family ATPase n=1 Tax=Thalassotalea sp. SU-HH00458 TaxID=3127657 RepID=UPI0031029615